MRPKKRERLDRRAERRIGRVPVSTPPAEDVLYDLANYGNRGGWLPAGYYMRQRGLGKDKEYISLYPGSQDDVLTHEQAHAAQTSKVARMLGLPGRTQEPAVRQAVRQLRRSMTRDQKDNVSNVVAYFVQDPTEMEAMVKAIGDGMNEMGISKDASFDEVRDAMKTAFDNNQLNTNMRNMYMFMDDYWDDKQKGYIMDAIRYSEQ